MIYARHAKGSTFAAALLCAAAANAATVSNGDLSRCAGIAAPATRLACYDTLAHRAPDATTAATTAATPDAAPAGALGPTTSATVASPLAAVAPTAAPAAAYAAPASPAAAATPPDDPKSFGLSAAQRHVAVVGPKEESARIVSLAANQAGHSTIVLDSGQTWAILDDDGFVSNGDQVTIKRAALGSYLMMTPSHHAYRVHRIQ